MTTEGWRARGRLRGLALAATAMSALFAIGIGRIEGPRDFGLSALIVVWASTPGLAAYFAAAASSSLRLPEALQASSRTFCWAVSLLSVVGYGIRFLAAPADPDTAGHMGPYLMPLVLIFLGLVTSVCSGVVLLGWRWVARWRR